MLGVTLAVAVAAVASFAYYLGHEQLRAEGVGLALLRATGLGLILVLVLNPSWMASGTGAETVLLDGSLSMGAAGGRFREAADTADALAGSAGRILRFGTDVHPEDGAPPTDGASRIREALNAARARGGGVSIVSDGEISDAAAVPEALRARVRVVLLRRDSVPGLALSGVDVPSLAGPEDTVNITLTIATWGGLSAERAAVEIREGTRRLWSRDVMLAPAPATVRRRVALPPGTLSPGRHALEFSVRADGDVESRDNVRRRIVAVSDQPTAVVIVDPAGWEGRFLVRTLTEVSGAAVQAYARTAGREWVDMRTGDRTSIAAVRAATARGRLLILCGDSAMARGWRGPVWYWPGDQVSQSGIVSGEWYVLGGAGVSPLTAALAGLAWDSLPPLDGVVPAAVDTAQWIALAARLGRRGVSRPVLIGGPGRYDRALRTTSVGLWRWSLRGGQAAEAYRSLVAAGIDWLLRSATAPGMPAVRATVVAQRGVPVQFAWRRATPPDTLHLAITDHESGTRRDELLALDADGTGAILLDPGVYEWRTDDAPGERGWIAVEEYSDEFVPAPVTLDWQGTGQASVRRETSARSHWWLFALVAVAFGSEWAWRRRRGLP